MNRAKEEKLLDEAIRDIIVPLSKMERKLDPKPGDEHARHILTPDRMLAYIDGYRSGLMERGVPKDTLAKFEAGALGATFAFFESLGMTLDDLGVLSQKILGVPLDLELE